MCTYRHSAQSGIEARVGSCKTCGLRIPLIMQFCSRVWLGEEGDADGVAKAPPSTFAPLMGLGGDKVAGLRYIVDREEKEAARLAREAARQSRAAQRRARRRRQPRLPIARGASGEAASIGGRAVGAAASCAGVAENAARPARGRGCAL